MSRLWAKATAARGWSRALWSPLILLLRLTTPIYQWFSRRHLARRKASCSPVGRATVISVGNITVGGSGKTPVVIHMAERLLAHGKKVAIVHSGYGRRSEEDVFVEYDQGPNCAVDTIGDEVAMMTRRLPTAAFAVGRDKKNVAGEADRRFAPDVIIIDDGYQRLDIQKNLDIVVISPDVLAGRARLFPGGILRERLETLERAHAVFIMHADEIMLRERIDAAARGFNAAAPMIHWRLTLDGAETDGKVVGLESMRGLRPYLFAAIGSFPRMYDMVTRAGIQPAGWFDFGDHHRYTDADGERLRHVAERCGADAYLTTPKDAVKLGGLRFDRPVYTLRLAAEPLDTEALDRLMELA